MIINKKTLFCLEFFFCVVFAFSQVSFSDIDINASDSMLFSVEHKLRGVPSYKTIFSSKLKNESCSFPTMITCYPEQISVLNGGSALQIKNRYGVSRFFLKNEHLQILTNSGTKGNEFPLDSMRQFPDSVSPDGKWACTLKKEAVGKAKLVLQNVNTMEEVVLDPDAEHSFDFLPVKWEKTGAYLLYEKDGAIYFTEPAVAFKEVQPAEEYRFIGKGKISCVEWTDERSIVYINSGMMYKIRANGLYTRGLYNGLVSSWEILCRLAFDFSPDSDTFYVNSDASAFVVIHANKAVSLNKVKAETLDYADTVFFKSMVSVEKAVVKSEVYWRNKESALLYLMYGGKEKSCTIYSLTNTVGKLYSYNGNCVPAISPEKNYFSLANDQSVLIFSSLDWKKKAEFPLKKASCLLWLSEKKLIAAGQDFVKSFELENSGEKVLFLSSAAKAFYDESDSVIIEAGDSKFYKYSDLDKSFTLVDSNPSYQKRESRVQNAHFRVFAGSSYDSRFENMLYARILGQKIATIELFRPKAAPQTKPRLSVVFDVAEDSDGLAHILNTLDEYNLTCTFFLNGEFIRRYPAEVKQIHGAGHPCASMFFTAADFMRPGFIVDDDFIRRGLARNEDDYYAASGGDELELYWHICGRSASKKMQEAAKSAGYTYVEALPALSDVQLLISELREGAVICVPISSYKNLPLILSTIIDAGYEIVPIHSL